MALYWFSRYDLCELLVLECLCVCVCAVLPSASDGDAFAAFLKLLQSFEAGIAPSSPYARGLFPRPKRLLHRSYLLGLLKQYTVKCAERQMSPSVSNHSGHCIVGLAGFSGRGKTTAAFSAGDRLKTSKPWLEAGAGEVKAEWKQFNAGLASGLLSAPVPLPLPAGVDCAALAKKNFHFIYTSFNTRTSLTGEEWEQYGFKGCIALRMLHWHFASSMDFCGFQEAHMDKYNWKSAKDPIHLALCTIAADLGGTVDAPAVLMVALDEYTVANSRRCVSPDCSNTQTIYTAFASLMTRDSKPYVFCPVLMGLVQQPLVEAERRSIVKFVPLPLHCLTIEECDLLADVVLSADAPHWRSDAVLRRFMFQARAVPKLLMGVLDKFKAGERNASTYQKIVSSMSDPQQVTPSTLRSFLRLFACVVLKQTQLFDGFDRLPEEHNTVTLSEWEDRGGIFRSTVLDWQIPPSIFASVLTLTQQEGCSEAERNLLYCIRYLCDH